jgi:hypothetical protein
MTMASVVTSASEKPRLFTRELLQGYFRKAIKRGPTPNIEICRELADGYNKAFHSSIDGDDRVTEADAREFKRRADAITTLLHAIRAVDPGGEVSEMIDLGQAIQRAKPFLIPIKPVHAKLKDLHIPALGRVDGIPDMRF